MTNSDNESKKINKNNLILKIGLKQKPDICNGGCAGKKFSFKKWKAEIEILFEPRKYFLIFPKGYCVYVCMCVHACLLGYAHICLLM